MGSLYFVRHGQTIWNVENKICGASDIALTKLGHEQALQAGKMIRDQGIKADVIFCSPLIRAKDTAIHISEMTGIPVKEENRLTEQNFGIFESTARNGLEFKAAKKQFISGYQGGESMFRLAQRVYNLLDELTSTDRSYILVAHNGIARVVESYFHEMTNDQYAAFGIDNCQILKYEWNNEEKDDSASQLRSDKTYSFWGAHDTDRVRAVIDDYSMIKTPKDLYDALSDIWCADTCAPRMREDWSEINKTLGQCSITAFLAQDIFGGKVRGILRPGGNYHCYNIVKGHRFDLTSEQFLYENRINSDGNRVTEKICDDVEKILTYREDDTEQFREVHFEKAEKKERYEYLKQRLKDYC